MRRRGAGECKPANVAGGQRAGRIESIIMSARQIIEELPKLTAADLLAVRQRLTELAAEQEDVALCDAMALEGA